MSSFIWGMIACIIPRNSQMTGRGLRHLLFSPNSSNVLLTVLHSDAHLGSAYTPLHFGLSLCNLLQHVWLPYPKRKGKSIAWIWGIVGLYECCIYREIKCRNFPSDPASYEWYSARFVAHHHSTIYCSRTPSPSFFPSFHAAILFPPHCDLES